MIASAMNLILWRHAEAEDAAADGDDTARALTAHGRKQARRVGDWLDRRLPDGTRVLSSPALRATQTADGLDREFELRDELAPDGTATQLLELVRWPDAKSTSLVVGHQPMLGRAIAQLLGMQSGECAIGKGALWWLRWQPARAGDSVARGIVVAVVTPNLLSRRPRATSRKNSI